MKRKFLALGIASAAVVGGIGATTIAANAASTPVIRSVSASPDDWNLTQSAGCGQRSRLTIQVTDPGRQVEPRELRVSVIAPDGREVRRNDTALRLDRRVRSQATFSGTIPICGERAWAPGTYRVNVSYVEGRTTVSKGAGTFAIHRPTTLTYNDWPIRLGRGEMAQQGNLSANGSRLPGIADQTVKIYFRADGTRNWQEMASVRTQRDGRYEARFATPRMNGTFKAVFDGGDTYQDAEATMPHRVVGRR